MKLDPMIVADIVQLIAPHSLSIEMISYIDIQRGVA